VTAHPIDRMIAAEEALIAAIDRDDIEGIEGSLTSFREALDGVRAEGAWHDRQEIVARITHALQLADAARTRIAYLSDRTRRQLDRLGTMGAQVRAHAYGRDGRVRSI
jgi:hypothetical protein